MNKLINIDYEKIEREIREKANKLFESKEKGSREKDSVVINLTSEKMIKGIILSEILGKPLSKRRKRRY